MSRTIVALARATVPGRPDLPRAAAKLAELAALAIASAVLRRAARRAYRELAALDDRTLKDIGLARSALASISQAVAEGQAAAVIAQFPWANSQRQHVTQR
jgi:uncharacterized protein YjiS (DUF1127 family)